MRSVVSTSLIVASFSLGMFRELIIAYLFGGAEYLAIFRLITGLPLALSDALIITVTSLMIGNSRKVDSKDYFINQQSLKWVFFVFFLLGTFTIPIQVYAFNLAAYQEVNIILFTKLLLCWLIVLLTPFIILTRAQLSIEQKKITISIGQSVRHLSFILTVLVAYFVGKFFSELLALIIALIISSCSVYLFYSLSMFDINRVGDRNCKKFGLYLLSSNSKFLHALIGAIGYQLMMAVGRTLDRTVSSYMGALSINSIDYSYVIITAACGLIFTIYNIVYLHTEHKTFSKLYIRKSIYLSLLPILPVSILLSFFSSDIIAMVYFRGSFSLALVELTSDIFRWQCLALYFVLTNLLVGQILIISGYIKAAIICVSCKLAFRLAIFSFIPPNSVDVIGLYYVIIELFGFCILFSCVHFTSLFNER